jgi:hypothetical protein
MAFPHPKSRKNKHRNRDKPNNGGVGWKFFKRTINRTDYRNAKDDVNPAKNRTFGGIFHDWFAALMKKIRGSLSGRKHRAGFLDRVSG